MKKRDPYFRIWQELSSEKAMVFMTGPRQSGKTTLANIISQSFSNKLYVNWDIPDDRTQIITDPFFFESLKRRDSSKPLIIFDEIHKYREWKNYLKGVADKFVDKYHFLVSGSGRLDIYQKGGDSLAGRYFLFHLWPFTIAELGQCNKEVSDFLKNPLEIELQKEKQLIEIWSSLENLSGFPEPFLSTKEMTYRRWSNTYSRQLIREDIRDLTGVKSINEIEALYYLLPSKVGSPISVQSLSQDLKVSYNTVCSWLQIFETFFLSFSISPWTAKISRAIQKEKKIYLWDTPKIKEAPARFENRVAQELYRAVTFFNDIGYGNFSLHFIRNKEKEEVDFLIANEHKPLILVEAKISDEVPARPLKKFQTLLNIPAVQLNMKPGGFRYFPQKGQSILVAPAFDWLATLPC